MRIVAPAGFFAALRRTNRASSGIVAILLFAGCAAPVVPRAPEIVARARQFSPREQMNLQVFEAVWRAVDRSFYDPKFHGADWPAAAKTWGPKAVAAKTDEELYRTLNQMLLEVKDGHTVALSPEDVRREKDEPRARIGINFVKLEGKWTVGDVHPGGPAADAGVQSGWLYLGRDGQPVGDRIALNLKEGDAGIYDFVDDRDVVRHVALKARMLRTGKWLKVQELEAGVVYLRFDGFDKESRRWLSEQLKAHRAAPAVIVDLRNNPGGEAFSLEITIGEFFTRNMPWGEFSKRGGSWKDVDSWQWGSARYPGRVVLLTSATTASCSEIFAHVLQHHGRALIVGRKTAGAVIGSVTSKLPDGGKVQVGILDYHGLDGKQLDGVGVMPDVPVAYRYATREDFRAGRDADLTAALAALKASPAHATSPIGDGRVQ